MTTTEIRTTLEQVSTKLRAAEGRLAQADDSLSIYASGMAGPATLTDAQKATILDGLEAFAAEAQTLATALDTFLA